jgi:hypothetical protein
VIGGAKNSDRDGKESDVEKNLATAWASSFCTGSLRRFFRFPVSWERFNRNINTNEQAQRRSAQQRQLNR